MKMDPILYWNDVALEANRRDFTDIPTGETMPKPQQGGPTLSSRALAIIHLAMYDAYAAADPSAGLPAYLPNLPVFPVGASPEASVAAAAHATLSALYSRQKAFFDTKHAQAGLSGAMLEEAHRFGVKVAQAHLEARRTEPDPTTSDDGYAASMARGAHRADPDNPGQGYHAPFYGRRSKSFAVTQRHGLGNSPRPGDAEYLKALQEVRAKGIAPELMGTLPTGFKKRTEDETIIGLFWAYDGAVGLGTPPRLYNQIVRKVAMAQPGMTTAKNARLFALVNAAMGDAGILAWDQKYIHDLWRPVLGIREHEDSLGPAATPGHAISKDCDPMWLPLGAPNSNTMGKNTTPPFPAYPSGHATFGAAALHITRLFFGIPSNNHSDDNLGNGLSFVSDELNGMNRDNKGTVRSNHARTFPGGLWQMIIENGRSRVFLGVHWVFDAFATKANGDPDLSQDIGGVSLGLKIAEDIFNNGLHPALVGPRTENDPT
jgi:Vanadium chloroperoxidase N-terminal domain/PAP2 superfamily